MSQPEGREAVDLVPRGSVNNSTWIPAWAGMTVAGVTGPVTSSIPIPAFAGMTGVLAPLCAPPQPSAINWNGAGATNRNLTNKAVMCNKTEGLSGCISLNLNAQLRKQVGGAAAGPTIKAGMCL